MKPVLALLSGVAIYFVAQYGMELTFGSQEEAPEVSLAAAIVAVSSQPDKIREEEPLATTLVAAPSPARNYPSESASEETPAGERIEVCTPLIEPIRWAEMRFEDMKLIREIPAVVNQNYEEGEVLAKQDARELESALKVKQEQLRGAELQSANISILEAARKQVKYTNSEETRAKALYEKQALAEASYAEAILKRHLAESHLQDTESRKAQEQIAPQLIREEIAGLQIQIEKRILRAPYPGQVIAVYAQPFQIPKEGSELVLRYASLDEVRVTGFIRETSFTNDSSIRVGSTVKLSLGSPGETSAEIFVGELTSIAAEITAEGTRDIVAVFPNRKTADRSRWVLSPGASSTMWIEAAEKVGSRNLAANE